SRPLLLPVRTCGSPYPDSILPRPLAGVLDAWGESARGWLADGRRDGCDGEYREGSGEDSWNRSRPGLFGAKGITARTGLPDGGRISDDFHLFRVDWSPGRVEFYLDNRSYSVVTRGELP